MSLRPDSPEALELADSADFAVEEVAVALTIAGSDPSGGAGIQADLKTFSALGVYGAAVLTALTAQNTRGVSAVAHLAPDFVAAQITAVLSDLRVGATKLGMLGDTATVTAVASALAPYAAIPLVIDPVMISKSGAALLTPDAVAAVKQLLVPRATLLTPNLPEAARLLGEDEAAIEHAPRTACERLAALGARAVLLKGGHAESPQHSDDLLFDGERGEWLRLPAPRIATRNTHGTGCTLSSAITAGLARGLPLRQAVVQAKRYLHAALLAGKRLSIVRAPSSPSEKATANADSGHGPVHHFHALWPSENQASIKPPR